VRLTENMRLEADQVWFSAWIREIGLGNIILIEVPKEMVAATFQELINHAYQNGEALKDPTKALEGLILAPVHEDVKRGNAIIMSMLTTLPKTYLSTDTSLKEDRPLDINNAQSEVDALNKLNPPNFPAHELILQEGSIVVLLLNLDLSRGLCNGTRMYVRELRDNLIICEVLTGTGAATGRGNLVGICRCRMPFEEKGKFDGVNFERLQFPLAPAFVMTILKGQGQTIKNLGVDLTHEAFGHGHTYTFFSRVTKSSGLKIFAPNSIGADGKTIIKNIVAKGLDLS
jgi:ATP-dependent DNA helicase PIF1